MTTDRVVSRADVARLAGVSPTTVSLVLNGKADEKRVAKKTQQRVRDAAEHLRYVPNSAARAMVGQRHFTVGIVTRHPPGSLHMPIFEYFAVGAIEEAARYQHTVKFLPPVTDPESYDVYGTLRDAQVDGILVHNLGWLAATLAEWRRPVVYVGLGDEPEPLPLDRIGAVTTDEHGGTRMAARHLLELGHTTVGVVGGADQDGNPVPRLRAFTDELTTGGSANSHYVNPGHRTWTAKDAYRATKELLASWPEVTALHTGSDWMAVGAMRAVHELGRAIPDDIAVIGFGDFHVSGFLTPPLTTITWPLRELGVRAVAKLLAQLDGDPAGYGESVLPTELVIRESTAGPTGVQS